MSARNEIVTMKILRLTPANNTNINFKSMKLDCKSIINNERDKGTTFV